MAICSLFPRCGGFTNDFLCFQGAFFSLLAGHTCGIIRMVLDFVYPAPQCGEDDTRPAIVANVHYTYYGQIIIIITVLVMVITSLLTEPVEEEEVQINKFSGGSRMSHRDVDHLEGDANTIFRKKILRNPMKLQGLWSIAMKNKIV